MNSERVKYYSYILLVLSILLSSASAFAQISPGDLTKAHASLEGLSNCNKCHEVGKKVTSAKCLACHKEIKNLIEAKRGYHVSSEVSVKECFSCHNEHHGRNFEIVRFEKEKFDHVKAGYELIGKHKTLECLKCHKNELISVKSSQKTGGNSYLGLGRECLSCHADYHQKTLSENCLLCHNPNSFKPASGFDHSKTKFRLLGKHASVDCIKCHKIIEPDGKKHQKFSGVLFRNCTDCHKDVHNGKFGLDCKKCHNEESFHQIAAIKTFDHTKTNYPLEGRHLYLECKVCHKQSYTTKLKFKSCTDCHADYHKGQLKKDGVPTDCSECHWAGGFKSSSYTIERHRTNSFPLKGAHVATPCISCHKKGIDWAFKNIGKQCIDCHENFHKNTISEKYLPDQNCGSCHAESSWKQVIFNHETTTFPLTGKHAAQSCRKCHFKDEPTRNTSQWFSNQTKRCVDCHIDIHFQQFETNDKAYCTRCHGYENWKVPQFNHDNTLFKLDGKHKDVACAKCHKEVISGSNRYIQYKFKEIRCSDCHLQ